MSWHSLPILVRVAGQAVIVLGDGDAAAAKRRLIASAGAIATDDEGSDARLAIVAIADDAAATATVARLRARGVLVNAVDRPELCDFTLPAIVDRDPVLVAIGTGGASAGLAAALRQRLEAILSPRLGALAALLRDARAELRAAFPDPVARRQAIAGALAPGGALDLADAGGDTAITIGALRQGGGGDMAIIDVRSDDPDDLTLRDARLLSMAERLYHTPDVPDAILNRARADAPRHVASAPPPVADAGLTLWLVRRG